MPRLRGITPLDLQRREVGIIVLAAAEDIHLGAHRLAHGGNALKLHGRDLGNDIDCEARRDAVRRGRCDDRLAGSIGQRLDDHGLVGRARALRRLERDDVRALRHRPVDVRILVHILAGGGDRRLRQGLIRRAPERGRTGQLDARVGLHHFARLPDKDGVAVVGARRVLFEGAAELVRKAVGSGDSDCRSGRGASERIRRRIRIVAVADRALKVCGDARVIASAIRRGDRAAVIAVTNTAGLRLDCAAATDAGSIILTADCAGIVAVFDCDLVAATITKNTCCNRTGSVYRCSICTVRDCDCSGIDSANNTGRSCRAIFLRRGDSSGKRAAVDRGAGLRFADDAAHKNTTARRNIALDLQILDGRAANRAKQAHTVARSRVHRQALDGVVRAVKCAGICL